MKAIHAIKELYLAENRRRFPSLPDYARVVPAYSDKTANGLTKCIIDFLRFSGHQAERINNTGRPLDQRQNVTDVLGHVRTIGSMKWIPGTGTRGTSDISSTIAGRSVKIEIKIGRDRQSEAQKQYQAEVERSGGLYYIATSFPQFYNWYQSTFPEVSRTKSGCHVDK
jgi:hypothetical protein